MNNAYDFYLEAEAAAFPVVGSHWQNSPVDARVHYQNDKSIELYGDLGGMLLADLFTEVLKMSNFNAGCDGNVLMQRLIKDGCITSVTGTLAGKRVDLFSSLQHNNEQIVQSTIIDVTGQFIDGLSGIPGRELFFDHLDIEVYRALRDKSELHVCFMDLDGFKQTNDLYGHQAGDDVIKEVGRRLRTVVRRHEIVARFGGDEFVLLLSGSKVDSVSFAEKKLIPLLNEPYIGAGHKIDFIGVSVGISSAPTDAKTPDELINHADDAMYVAKSRGKNRAVVFEPGMEGMKKH